MRLSRRELLQYLSAPILAAVGLALFGIRLNGGEEKMMDVSVDVSGRLSLPAPRYSSGVSVEETLLRRRSIREYSGEALSLEQVSQLLWAAQGVTEPRWGFRTAPSAGATYPLEVYLVVKRGGVKGLEPGIYHYLPHSHELELIRKGDYSRKLMAACLDQEWVGAAAVNIVLTAVFERTTRHYGERGVRYVYMEVGHVGENIYLQCVSLGLGCVVVGAFYDEDVKRILGVDEAPMYVIPVGVLKK